MKKSVNFFGSLVILTLILSVGAFAKDTHSGKFTLAETARVGSTTLQPGDYKAEWSGPASNVKVDILKNGKIVASTEGTIKNLGQPASYDAVMTKTMDDNSKTLDEIDFSRRSEALVLQGE